MTQPNVPDFPSWQRHNLDQFAREAHQRLRQQDDALDQLRQDLREAMAQNRILLTKDIK